VLFFSAARGAFLLTKIRRLSSFDHLLRRCAVVLAHKIDETGEQEKMELGVFSVLINIFALIALSLEFGSILRKTSYAPTQTSRAIFPSLCFGQFTPRC